MRNQYRRAVRTSNKNAFTVTMKDIQDINTNAFKQLRNLNLKYQSVYTFYKFIKYDYTTNNITESWNTWIGEMRKAPIITLVEYIKKKKNDESNK